MHDERLLALLDSDRRLLVRAASRLLGPADAEDAVQDAYVRALEAEGPALNSTQAWLLTVVRNLAIDSLRRRNWMQQWLAETGAEDTPRASPSAESDAALAQEATRVLHLLAEQLTPQEGAAVLLHEVFGVGHAEMAQARGMTEAGSRQQLRRALLRLRQAGGAAQPRQSTEQDAEEKIVLRLYLQALQLRNPQTLWAMLRHPPIQAGTHTRAHGSVGVGATTRASTGVPAMAAQAASAPHAVTSGVVQVGGQLGLVLTLDGVTLCVVPLGVRSAHEPEAVQ